MLLNGLKGFINPSPSLCTAGAAPLGVAALLPSSYTVNRHTLSGSGAPTAHQGRVNRPVLIQSPCQDRVTSLHLSLGPGQKDRSWQHGSRQCLST